MANENLIARVSDPAVSTDDLHRQFAEALSEAELVISALTKIVYDEWPEYSTMPDILNTVFLGDVADDEKAAIARRFAPTPRASEEYVEDEG